MTINASSLTNAAFNSNSSNASTFNVSSSSTSTSTATTELTDEEKNYDIDNDGTLSATEKKAMLEAQANEKVINGNKSKNSLESQPVSVNISDEGLKMQKQNSSEPQQETNEVADVSKRTSNQAPSNEQRLMNEAISEYKKFNSDSKLSMQIHS